MQPIIPQNPTQHTFDFDAMSDQPIDDPVPHITDIPPQKEKHWWSDLEHQTIPRSPGIYAIINQRNQHFYIGSAKNLLQRKRDHFKGLQTNKHGNSHLQRAYNYYGANAFLFVIVEHVEHAENLISREQHYMDTLVPQYNIARIAGSCLGIKHTPETIEKLRAWPRTPETRAKLRAANLRNPPNLEAIASMRAANLGKSRSSETKEKLRITNLGRRHTPKNLEKMRAAKLGKKQSPETKAKRSASLRGRKHTPEAVEKMRAAKKGKQFSPEHREKLRAAKLGKKHTNETRAKMSASRRGKKESPETIEKKRAAALRGKKPSPEHMAKATEAARIANTGRKRPPEVTAKVKATKAAKREAKLAQERSNQPPLF